MQGLINPGAAILFLGTFGCRGLRSPRMGAKQGSHQSPVGEEVDAVEPLIFASHDVAI